MSPWPSFDAIVIILHSFSSENRGFTRNFKELPKNRRFGIGRPRLTRFYFFTFQNLLINFIRHEIFGTSNYDGELEVVKIANRTQCGKTRIFTLGKYFMKMIYSLIYVVLFGSIDFTKFSK